MPTIVSPPVESQVALDNTTPVHDEVLKEFPVSHNPDWAYLPFTSVPPLGVMVPKTIEEDKSEPIAS